MARIPISSSGRAPSLNGLAARNSTLILSCIVGLLLWVPCSRPACSGAVLVPAIRPSARQRGSRGATSRNRQGTEASSASAHPSPSSAVSHRRALRPRTAPRAERGRQGKIVVTGAQHHDLGL